MSLKIYKFQFFFFLFSFLFLSSEIRASHIMGADLSYTCLGNNQYRVTLRLYRDCCGIPVSTTDVIQVYNGCTGTSSSVTVTQVPGSGQEVSELCPSQLSQSTCANSNNCPANPAASPPTYPGVQVYIYQATVTLSSQCNQWYFRYSSCCRNNAINNIAAGGGSTGLGIQALVNNTNNPATGQPYCNSSVQFSTLPVPFVCLNENFTYNNGAVDPNGDSLSYTLIAPLNDSYAPIAFSGGWSANNPVRTNPPSNFQFDTHTGQLSFTPPYQEVDVLAIQVNEYRNGVLVGTTIRDIQVSIFPCSIAIPDQDGISNVQNGNQVNSISVQTCPGTPLQVDIVCTDPANHNLTITSNINSVPSSIPGATLTQIGTGDTVIARLNWTPAIYDTGCRLFTLTDQNNDCPLNGSYTAVYSICVFNKVQLLSASPTYCGTPVQLTATGGTNFQWTPSTGPNAVSNPNVLNPTVSPVSTTKYYFTSDCGTDSVTINAAPPFLYDAGPGGSICQNGQIQLNATTDNLYSPYSFKWVPPAGLYDPITGLPSDSVANPVASPLSTTQYKCYITGNNGCVNADSLIVNVAGTGPVIVAKATPNSVCPDDSVQLQIVTNPQSCGISLTPCSGNIFTGQVGTGTGNSVTTPTNYPTVYGHYKNSARHQFLYLASDLLSQFPSGGEIRSISFYISAVNQQNDTMKNFEIKMGCTQHTSLTNWEPNLSTVFSPKSVSLPNAPGWITHTLDFPYNWDGTTNLVIDVCFSNPSGAATLNSFMQVTTTPYASVYYTSGNTSQCGNTGTPQSSSKRPNAKFDICVTDVSNLPISWTPNTGPNAPNPTHNSIDPIAHPESPVIYHVDVTAANGCVSSDFVFVNVDTSTQFHAFPDDTFFCSPTTVQLTTVTTTHTIPTPNFQYQWKNLNNNTIVGTTPNITVQPAVSTDYLVTLTGATCTLHDTVHVRIGNNLPVNLIVTPITCNGAANGAIRAVLTGGTPPINYTWSNAVTGIDSIRNLGPGNYWVHISDSQGCAGADTVNLTQPAVLSVTARPHNIPCFGQGNGSIALTTTGGTLPYHYAWTPSEPTVDSISGLAAGNYSVVVTDSNGCTANAAAAITEPTALTLAVLSNHTSVVGGNDGWAYAIVGGGTAPYVYTWSNGGTTDTIQNLVAGTYYVTVCDAHGCCLHDSAVVTDPPPIILTYNITNNPCFGDCKGGASVSAAGGIAPYAFVWSNTITGDTIGNLCNGIYSVIATDSAGITVSGSVNITSPAAVTIVLDTTAITCFGANNAAITAHVSGGTGPYTYQWNVAGTDSTQTGLIPGTYDVTATDAHGCTGTASWTATEPAQLTEAIASVTNVSCFGGSDGSAIANTNGGTPGYGYNWSVIGTSGDTATGFPAGNNYNVTVTDSRGCTATATFSITQPTAITTSFAVANATCNGLNDASIDLTVTGGTPTYTYMWSNTAVIEDLSGITAGNYTVTITDSKNCTVTADTTVSEPTAIVLAFTHTDPLCTGLSNGHATVSATGGTPGYTYDWAAITGTNDGTALNNVPAGTYDVTATDANTCTTTGNVILTNPPSLDATLINIQEITCANAADGSVEVFVSGGTPPVTFAWNNGSSQAAQHNLAPGTYNVTVADANACDTSLSYTFNAPPYIGLNVLQADSVSCPDYTDGIIHVEANGGTPGVPVPYLYSINGGAYQAAETFESLPAGIYHVSIRDGQGCTKDTTIIVYEPARPDFAVTPSDTTIDLGNSVALYSIINNYHGSDINFYTWSPLTGLNCGDCPYVIAAPYTHTEYTLTINYLHNCSVSQLANVYVGNGDDFFVPNAFSPNGDGNNDILNVYGTGLASARLKIFNRWGELVFDSGSQWLGWDGTYKGVLQNPGVYTYYVQGVYLNGKKREKKGTVTLLR